MEDKYLKALYVQFSDGTELKGVDAFIYVWNHTQGYRWLATFTKLPFILPFDFSIDSRRSGTRDHPHMIIQACALCSKPSLSRSDSGRPSK